jgi:polyisoprenoid-binding protein YceI
LKDAFKQLNQGDLMKKLIAIAFVLVAMSAAMAQQTTTKTFYINDSTKRDVVTFTSKAPLETIVGKTAEVKGYITVNPADISGSAKAKFEVNLDSLKTGIGMRDQHMREQYLETAKFPKTTFELTKVVTASQNALEDKKEILLSAEGNYTVHGVTKVITVPLTITYFKESEETKPRLPGDLLHISGSFTVLLSDYGINRPQFVILKLEDKQKVDIDLFSSTGSPVVDFGSK